MSASTGALASTPLVVRIKRKRDEPALPEFVIPSKRPTLLAGLSLNDDDGPNEEPPKRGSPVPSLDTAGSDRGSERGASSNTAAAAASSIASVAVGGSGTGKAASSSEPDSGGASRAQPFSKRCASLVSM